MKLRLTNFALAAIFGLLTQAATARPVTDCPLRDLPFSIDSPLIDVLLSPTSRALLEQVAPGRFDDRNARFTGVNPPSFTTIVTVRSAGWLTGLNEAQLAKLDPQLRALPVTAADRSARCARYDNDVPTLPSLRPDRPSILLFGKVVGFRDDPSIKAAQDMFISLAQRNGWNLVITDRAGAFNPSTLRHFQAVVWNNVSGDVLTLSQRKAFQRYIERGGGFVGVHGSGGDPEYFWKWYADDLLGARFSGHPHSPQFQSARIAVDPYHPLARNLPGEWVMTDEWYSFRTNPRTLGARVLLSLDESTYSPGDGLRMGDHPIAWTRCVGRGRMFYSAIGHVPEAYRQPQHEAVITAAVNWAATATTACPSTKQGNIKP